ncbi:MAG: hypothetical protein WD096_11110 [Actinomycetota bacterium]
MIDRFTRDDVSAKVWWPLAMLLVVLFVLTFPARGRDRDDAFDGTASLGASLVRDIVTPAYAHPGAPGALSAQETARLDDVVTDDILEEVASVDAVRLWALDGELLFSSSPADEVGSRAATNDASIEAAAANASGPVAFLNEEGLTGEAAPPRFDVYQAIEGRSEVVAQIEFDDEAVLADVSTRWLAWRIALGSMGLLTLLLAALSTREPIASSGAGVKFYPTSVPLGSAVVGADDAALVQQTGLHARRRVQEMQERMEELELEKARLEGDLQRALSGRSMAAPAATPAIPRPAERRSAAPPSPPAPEPPRRRKPVVVQIPEPEPIVAAASPPLVVEHEPMDAVNPRETTVSDEPMGPVLVPEPEASPPSRRAPTSDRWAASTAPVVRIPEAKGAGSDSDQDVLSVLERLVEPVGAGETSEDAASDMRTRLARTAAAKKPGSRSDDRFHEHPEHH